MYLLDEMIEDPRENHYPFSDLDEGYPGQGYDSDSDTDELSDTSTEGSSSMELNVVNFEESKLDTAMENTIDTGLGSEEFETSPDYGSGTYTIYYTPGELPAAVHPRVRALRQLTKAWD